MLFRSLAVLAVIPSLIIAVPVDSNARRHSLNKRCKARGLPAAASAAPATDAVQGTYPSPSATDAVPTTPAPAPTEGSPQAPAASEPSAPQGSSSDDAPAPTSTKSSSASDDAPSPTSTKSSEDSAKPPETQTQSEPKPSSTGKPSSSSNNDNLGSDLVSALLPKGAGNTLWSTAQGLVRGAVKLSLGAFNANSVMSRAPALFTGDNTLKVHFKAGSWTFQGPSPSGLSFYAQPLDLSRAKEVTLSYRIKFDAGFDFHRGGKLPGLYGGESDALAKGCSGGRRSTACHSARFMFRAGGLGELYTYLPPPSLGPQFAGNARLCSAVPHSTCNSEYGASVGRGAFAFPRGEFVTIAQRARLNDVGKANGELELIVDGESKFTVRGLAYRDSEKHTFRGIQMQSFFGGSSADWASPKDQSLEMKDFSLVVTDTF